MNNEHSTKKHIPSVTKLGHEQGAVLNTEKVVPPKTGYWRFYTPTVGADCIGCGICAARCPEKSIQIKGERQKRKAVIDYDFCKGCGICVAVCPRNTVTMR